MFCLSALYFADLFQVLINPVHCFGMFLVIPQALCQHTCGRSLMVQHLLSLAIHNLPDKGNLRIPHCHPGFNLIISVELNLCQRGDGVLYFPKPFLTFFTSIAEGGAWMGICSFPSVCLILCKCPESNRENSDSAIHTCNR